MTPQGDDLSWAQSMSAEQLTEALRNRELPARDADVLEELLVAQLTQMLVDRAYRTASAPVAGWYPDPVLAAKERYWNGTSWTNKLRKVRR